MQIRTCIGKIGRCQTAASSDAFQKSQRRGRFEAIKGLISTIGRILGMLDMGKGNSGTLSGHRGGIGTFGHLVDPALTRGFA
eukprot:scaffold11046_cov183-Amphora_coffeaeformis.AAC.16